MATPSLAMIPSAYADSKVYSVLPNNGDGDFTFNRDSSATRVGQNGLIQTVGYFGNELVTNGDFATDSVWVKSTGVSIGSGICTFTSVSSIGSVRQGITSPTGKTFRVTYEILSITSGGYNITLNGNVNQGTTRTAAGIYSEEIIAGVLTSTTFGIHAVGTTSGSIDNVSVKEVTGDQPRLNYDISNGVVQSCPSLLLEPASTNLVTYSEDFTQSAWVKLGAGTGSAAVVTSNYATSPDGTQNASRLQCDLNGGGSSSSNQSLIYDSYTSSGNQTISIYIKSNNGQNQTIYFANTQTSGDTITVTSQWQRFSFSHSAATYVFAVGLRGRTGGAINDTADILIYGAQIEALSYATSYIPTNGASQTRTIETCIKENLSSTILNPSYPFSMYAKCDVVSTNSGFAITLSNPLVGNQYFTIEYFSNLWHITSRPNGPSIRASSTTAPTIGTHKVLGIFTQSDMKLYLNGSLIVSGTNNEAWNNAVNGLLLGQLRIASDTGTRNTIREAQFFKTELTNAQAVTLTT